MKIALTRELPSPICRFREAITPGAMVGICVITYHGQPSLHGPQCHAVGLTRVWENPDKGTVLFFLFLLPRGFGRRRSCEYRPLDVPRNFPLCWQVLCETRSNRGRFPRTPFSQGIVLFNHVLSNDDMLIWRRLNCCGSLYRIPAEAAYQA